jgi:2',3'-cyclic-nucleotide 2'-phosphodiesterase (5'-nucleotidase family)
VSSYVDSSVPYYEEVDEPAPDEAVKETLEKVEEDLLAQTNRFCINGNCED